MEKYIVSSISLSGKIENGNFSIPLERAWQTNVTVYIGGARLYAHRAVCVPYIYTCDIMSLFVT